MLKNQIKVAFDGQVLMDESKSGIGLLAEQMVKQLVQMPTLECSINAFFLGRTDSQRKRLFEYGIEGNKIHVCRWFHRGIYLRTWHYFPIPFRLFFPHNDADISVFWNYDTPPGVKGKSIVFVHDMTYMAYAETMDEDVLHILTRNMKDTCRRADIIVTLSEFSKAEIVKYLNVPEKKIRIVPCGVDQLLFRPINDTRLLEQTKVKYNIEGDYFIYVGTIEPRKNIEFLIKAYAKAFENCDSFPKLVFVGKKGWKTDKIYEMSQKYGIEENIIFTGYAPREDLPILMSGALSFLFPSIYEGFGMPPLEAMACGTPVIVSNCASLPEVVGEAGIVVSVETEENLASAIRNMAYNEALREEYSKKGLEHVKKYTWKKSAEILLEICEELYEKNS